jgi:hypothetical protein
LDAVFVKTATRERALPEPMLHMQRRHSRRSLPVRIERQVDDKVYIGFIKVIGSKHFLQGDITQIKILMGINLQQQLFSVPRPALQKHTGISH